MRDGLISNDLRFKPQFVDGFMSQFFPVVHEQAVVKLMRYGKFPVLAGKELAFTLSAKVDRFLVIFLGLSI